MEHAMTRTARAFPDELTNIANHHGEIMRGMTEKAAMDHVKSVIADNDIVFGIWEDESEANGVGVLVIKGDRGRGRRPMHSVLHFRGAMHRARSGCCGKGNAR